MYQTTIYFVLRRHRTGQFCTMASHTHQTCDLISNLMSTSSKQYALLTVNRGNETRIHNVDTRN